MPQTKYSDNTNLKPASAKKRQSKEPVGQSATTENKTRRIVIGLIFLLLSICVFVSYFYNEGSFIIIFTNVIKGAVGFGYWAIGLCFLVIFFNLCFSESKHLVFKTVSALLFPIIFSSLLHLLQFGSSTTLDINSYIQTGKDVLSGGVLGSLIAYVSNKLFGQIAGGIILFIILIILLIVILGANFKMFKSDIKDDINIGSKSKKSAAESSTVVPVKEKKQKVIPDIEPVVISRDNQSKQKKKTTTSSYDIPMGKEETKLDINKIPAKTKPAVKKTVPVLDKNTDDIFSEVPAAEIKKPARLDREELHRETVAVKNEIEQNDTNSNGLYVYPPTSLLSYGKANGSDSKEEISATKGRLENTLHSFGINSNVVNITPGPTVTRYDIKLEQGVKLSKVTNLAGDIALSLGVMNVRIAPIPDEISRVGIEVPNKIINTVSLREIIESDNFKKAKSKLTFAIGKDIGGNAIVGNISKLPHMLIAGTTGSGKSVCMNSLIISLLYKARPDEVKFIMIDPKMVELGVYNSIPHLYCPVVTDPKKAAGALQWAVVEMLKRYKLFSEAGVRDLETYNSFCINNNENTMPQVVIVVDELADLMMAASKEVEECICRVAQMGRAAGMHLIIATQRPSADVITGLMKANIPSRIAFAVSSAMESRIIMDTSGAEKLIGMGDMLYSPLGLGKPLRVQGSYISDSDRENIINFIKDKCDIQAEKNEDLLDAMNNASDIDSKETDSKKEDNSPAGDYDEMLPKAVEIVIEMKSCSVSMLQRRLKLGYSRAARVVDQMEELGVVGPYEGAKPRSVLVDRDGWHEISSELGMLTDDDFALASEINSQENL